MVYPRVSLFPGENRYSPKNCPGLSRITRPSPGHPPRYRKRTTGRPLEPAGSPASGNLQKPVCAGLPAGVPPSKEKPPLVGVSRAGDGTRTHDLLLGKETFYQLNHARNLRVRILASFPGIVKNLLPLTALGSHPVCDHVLPRVAHNLLHLQVAHVSLGGDIRLHHRSQRGGEDECQCHQYHHQ